MAMAVINNTATMSDFRLEGVAADAHDNFTSASSGPVNVLTQYEDPPATSFALSAQHRADFQRLLNVIDNRNWPITAAARADGISQLEPFHFSPTTVSIAELENRPCRPPKGYKSNPSAPQLQSMTADRVRAVYALAFISGLQVRA